VMLRQPCWNCTLKQIKIDESCCYQSLLLITYLVRAFLAAVKA